MSASLRVLVNRIPALISALGAGADAALERRALAIEADWKAGVRVDTGRLRRSIEIKERRRGRIVVATDVDYAGFENYGTTRMRGSYAREKAVEKNRAGFAADVAKAILP